jgi:hypothetical protein
MDTSDRHEQAEAPIPYSPPAIGDRAVIDARLISNSHVMCL